MLASLIPWALLIIPASTALACGCCPAPRLLPFILTAGSALFAATATAAAWCVHDGATLSTGSQWLYIDALSGFHLAVMALVFLISAIYTHGYFQPEIASGAFNRNTARRFGLLWSGAMAAMTLILISNNIGILWVSMEATTLVTTFLICTHRTPASLEATWKYLIICSVGVAFAFMGTLLTGAAARNIPIPPAQALLWTNLQQYAPQLNPGLMKGAFLFLLTGYGTKAGLAPMHSWLPDAHSQAPAPVSAIFSGFMLNAAIYCILRYIPLAEACTGHQGWSLRLMLIFGIISILTAAAFIVFQRDIKRLLAYSSVEHIGIIATGIGLGAPGLFAALLHTLNNALCKPLAFFAAGKLGQTYGTLDMNAMTGALRTTPVWGKALLASLLALIGAAPFGIFLSEFLTLRAAAQQHAYWTMGCFLTGTAIIFISVLQHIIRIAWSPPPENPPAESTAKCDNLFITLIIGAALLLGLWLPTPLTGIIQQAASIIMGKS